MGNNGTVFTDVTSLHVKNNVNFATAQKYMQNECV